MSGRNMSDMSDILMSGALVVTLWTCYGAL